MVPDSSCTLRGYRFLEHMTDAEVEAYGKTLDEAFENAGRAVEDTMVDIATIKKVTKEEITLEAKDNESLLYSWLEALINKQDIDGMLYSDFECRISRIDAGYRLVAKLSGEKFDSKRHEAKTAIKSPTYHGMKILERPNEVTVRFLLDL